MPGGKTHWNDKWLDKEDDNSVQVFKWCKSVKGNNELAYCTLCCKQFSISNSGFNQVKQHSKSSKHKQISDTRFGKNTSQTVLCMSKEDTTQKGLSKEDGKQVAAKAEASGEMSSNRPATATSSDSKPRQIQHVIPSQPLQHQATESELLWCFKVAASDFSFRSCDGINLLFQKMFKCEIAERFSLSKSKASYIVSEAIRPFLIETIVKEVIDGNLGYVLMFDETTTAQQCRQMDILIRFWSSIEGEVSVRFLKAVHFGHATADIVSEALLELGDGDDPEVNLPMKNLISLSSDGPNVNKSIHRKINESLKAGGNPGLLDFEPCNLHTVHNAFRKGLNCFGSDAEELTFDMYQFFKQQPVRREDFKDLQLEYNMDESLFLRHVPSRWLTLLPAMTRVLTNWKVSMEYFTVQLPKSMKSNSARKQLESNERYRRICHGLKDKKLLFQFAFLSSIAPLFQRFLTLFQTRGPIIHILLDECSTLLPTLMFRFIKKDVVGEKSGKRLLDIGIDDMGNHLPDKEVEIGEAGRQQLSKMAKEQHQLIMKNVKKFYTVVAEYLVGHLPLGNELLNNLQFLHPLLKTSDKGSRAITSVARKLPHVISEEEIPSLKNEWFEYSTSYVPKEWSEDKEGQYIRVDHYWRKVTDQKTSGGQNKYPTLSKVVKSVLTLAHGNADVERSLSDNKNTVTPERTNLNIETINGLRLAKEKVAQVKGVHNLQLPNKLVCLAARAKSRYEDRLQKEKEELSRKQKENEEKMKTEELRQKELDEINRLNRSYDDQEKQLKKEEEEFNNVLKSAEVLLKEATEKLSKALKAKNDLDIQVAQGMLESSENRMEKGRKGLQTCQQKRNEISKKRSAAVVKRKQVIKCSTSASNDNSGDIQQEPAKKKMKSGEKSKSSKTKN